MVTGDSESQWVLPALAAAACFGTAYFAADTFRAIPVLLTVVLQGTGGILASLAVYRFRDGLWWVFAALAGMCLVGSFTVEPLLGKVPTVMTVNDVLVILGGILTGVAAYENWKQQ